MYSTLRLLLKPSVAMCKYLHTIRSIGMLSCFSLFSLYKAQMSRLSYTNCPCQKGALVCPLGSGQLVWVDRNNQHGAGCGEVHVKEHTIARYA